MSGHIHQKIILSALSKTILFILTASDVFFGAEASVSVTLPLNAPPEGIMIAGCSSANVSDNTEKNINTRKIILIVKFFIITNITVFLAFGTLFKFVNNKVKKVH